jgi:putative addiction module CopG family antidote
MSLDLKPEVEGLVRETVESGRYRDANDVVSQAVALLRRQDAEKLATLQAALDEGDAAFREGRFVTVRTDEELDALFARL